MVRYDYRGISILSRIRGSPSPLLFGSEQVAVSCYSLCPSVQSTSAVVVESDVDVYGSIHQLLLLLECEQSPCPPFTAVPIHEQSHVMVVAS